LIGDADADPGEASNVVALPDNGRRRSGQRSSFEQDT
jgi:hypothetical protein